MRVSKGTLSLFIVIWIAGMAVPSYLYFHQIRSLEGISAEMEEWRVALLQKADTMQGHIGEIDQKTSTLQGHVVQIDRRTDILHDHVVEIEQSQDHLASLIQKIEQSQVEQVMNLEVTAYTPTEMECDDDPLVAASMRKVRLGTVAVSRDLFESGWVFGKKIYITGQGIFEINDLMNKRFSNRIDIFMWERNKALEFGKRQAKVALLNF
jgi:3D (Asp-Asp-Asp) domain-containing protein